MSRKSVSVARRGGRAPVVVLADVCGACGERYFDLKAMRVIEG